jgi:hypothetical protein
MKRSTTQAGAVGASVAGSAVAGGLLGSVTLGVAFGLGLAAVLVYVIGSKSPKP